MQRMIIDVREPEEFIKGHVQGAINVPPSDIMHGSEALKDVPKDIEIILYCVSGSRSNVSKQILESQGFTNVINGINKDQVQSKYGS
jgi:phage shock protein E